MTHSYRNKLIATLFCAAALSSALPRAMNAAAAVPVFRASSITKTGLFGASHSTVVSNTSRAVHVCVAGSNPNPEVSSLVAIPKDTPDSAFTLSRILSPGETEFILTRLRLRVLSVSPEVPIFIQTYEGSLLPASIGARGYLSLGVTVGNGKGTTETCAAGCTCGFEYFVPIMNDAKAITPLMAMAAKADRKTFMLRVLSGMEIVA